MKPSILLLIVSVFLSAPLGAHLAKASDDNTLPVCMGKGSPLPIDNARALELKKSNSADPVRANVAGKIEHIFMTQCNSKGTCHDHFEIKIGPKEDDVLEVIYSDSLRGRAPEPLGPTLSVSSIAKPLSETTPLGRAQVLFFAHA
ncbi:hypothetical protein WDW86_03615, partial [Bdellovibrionota bacterium FG-2]